MNDFTYHHHHHNRRLLFVPPEPQDKSTYRRVILDKTLSIAFIIIFFATLSYLIFTSIGHCLRRRRSLTEHTMPDEKNENSCVQQLQTIPIFVFGDQAPLPSCSNSSGDDTDCCSVCLAEYQKGEELRVLPRCKHMFHKDCIDQWLVTRSSFCPICRDRVIERSREPSSINGDQRLNTSLGVNVVTSSHVISVL